jgi:hypothetical protein
MSYFVLFYQIIYMLAVAYLSVRTNMAYECKMN